MTSSASRPDIVALMLDAGNVQTGMRVLEIGTGIGYTAAAPRIPHEWVVQTRPGGLVVSPWSSTYDPSGLLSLTVADNGTATGTLINKTISFMELRDQRVQRASIAEVVRGTDTSEMSETGLHASHVCQSDAAFAIGRRVPGCQWEYVPTTGSDDRWQVWFLNPGSRSWARFDYRSDVRRWPVHQFGPRQLWDEIAAAYR